VEKFSADIVYRNRYPEFITLRISGNFLIGGLPRMEKALESLYEISLGKKVIFDLTETLYFNSTGWSLFLTAYKRLKAQNSELVLAGMNPDVLNVFEILEFGRFIRHYADIQTAFREVGGTVPRRSAPCPNKACLK
jgi:anti-anti-sigma factor